MQKCKNFIKITMPIFLTVRQIHCYTKYYVDYYKYNDRIKIIADELCISTDTVYKHIRTAKTKIYVLADAYLRSINVLSNFDKIKNKLKLFIKNSFDYDLKYIIEHYYINYDKSFKEACKDIGYTFNTNSEYYKYRKNIMNKIVNYNSYGITKNDLIELLDYNARIKKYNKYIYMHE